MTNEERLRALDVLKRTLSKLPRAQAVRNDIDFLVAKKHMDCANWTDEDQAQLERYNRLLDSNPWGPLKKLIAEHEEQLAVPKLDAPLTGDAPPTGEP
jgi:hypothetical protein